MRHLPIRISTRLRNGNAIEDLATRLIRPSICCAPRAQYTAPPSYWPSLPVSLLQFLFRKFLPTNIAAPFGQHHLVAIGAYSDLSARAVPWRPPFFHPVGLIGMRAILVLKLFQSLLVVLVESGRRVHSNHPLNLIDLAFAKLTACCVTPTPKLRQC